MRWKIVSGLALAAVLMAGTAGVRAGDVVVNGSTFGVSLLDNGATTPEATITFNGTPQTFTGFDDGIVTVTGSQTNTGSFDILVTSDQDLFPGGIGSSGNFFGGLLIGAGGQPLQLTQPVDLTSAFLNATGPNISIPIYYQFLPLISDADPWNGYFVGPGLWGGFYDIQGFGVESFDLSMQASPVPAPAAVWGGLGLMGLVLAGRTLQRRRQLGL